MHNKVEKKKNDRRNRAHHTYNNLFWMVVSLEFQFPMYLNKMRKSEIRLRKKNEQKNNLIGILNFFDRLIPSECVNFNAHEHTFNAGKIPDFTYTGIIHLNCECEERKKSHNANDSKDPTMMIMTMTTTIELNVAKHCCICAILLKKRKNLNEHQPTDREMNKWEQQPEWWL